MNTKGRGRSRSPHRRRNKNSSVTLSNIPYEYSWQDLKELVKSKVGVSPFVDMIDENGKSMGIAVVEFKTTEMANKAIELLHRHDINNRKLIVRQCCDRDLERLDSKKINSDNDFYIDLLNYVSSFVLRRLGLDPNPTDSLHVGNFNFDVSWQVIKDYFKLAGNVLKVDLAKDDNGKSRGFSIIKFQHPFEAVQALCMLHDHEFAQRKLRAKIDRDGNVPKPLSSAYQAEIEDKARYLTPLVVDTILSPETQSVERLCRVLDMRYPKGATVVSNGFGVDGLPILCMRDILRIIDLAMIRRGIPDPNKFGRDQGVLIDALMHAAKALEESNSRGPGTIRSIPSDYGSSVPPPPHVRHRDIIEPGPLRLGSGGGMKGDSGINSREYFSSAMKSQMNKTIVVKNLPLTFTSQELRSIFSEIAPVKSAEVKFDGDRRSRGFGYVHFFESESIDIAVREMDGAKFDGQPIRVEACLNYNNDM